MLKTKVKVGRITNLSDARYCAGMGVDWLGFSVGGVHDSMDPKKFKEITDWISGPEFVVEWSGSGIPGDFTSIIRAYNAGLVQINVHQLKNIPLQESHWIVALGRADWEANRELIRLHRDRIRYLQLTGESLSPDRNWVMEAGNEFPVLLGYGISEGTLDQLEGLPIEGIALEGTPESRPGLKDYAHLSAILEGLEVE